MRLTVRVMGLRFDTAVAAMFENSLHIFWLIWLAGAATAFGGLTFSETRKESPAPEKPGQVIVDFPFSNNTQTPAVIRTLQSSCHCLTAEIVDGKLRYAPGEKGVVRARVKFDDISRSIDEQIALWLEGDAEFSPSATLAVRLVVPEYLKIEPHNLTWALGEATAPKIIRIRADDKYPAHLTKLEIATDKFTQTHRTITNGKEYEVEVRPADTTAPSFSILRLETDSPLARYKVITCMLSVRSATP